MGRNRDYRAKERVDWAGEAGRAITYFNSRNVVLEDIIDELSEESIGRLNVDQVLNLVSDKLVNKIKGRRDIDPEEAGRHSSCLAVALLIYRFDRDEGKAYKNFYEFLANYKLG